jgi:hypothetical protein
MTLAGRWVPLHTIQRWLGHTNVSQTSTNLAVTDQGQHEAMARFDAERATPSNVPAATDSGRFQEKLAKNLQNESGKVVRPARLERATSWFVARRSIQLS